MNPIRLGIIGCGAVTTKGYLPACRSLSDVEVVWVVDAADGVACHTAAEFGVPGYSQDYRKMLGQADAVVIATPPALHASMASDCLGEGLHVLCEKPLTRTVVEAEPLIELAKKRGVHFAVSTNRRFSHSARLLKTVLDKGMVGRVLSFELEEGHEFRWPVRSGYRFKKGLTGGGVLAEFGPHIIDNLLWWLGGSVEVISYRDDCLGGVESNADMKLILHHDACEVQGSITISNTRNLSNTVTICGDQGTVTAGLLNHQKIYFHPVSDEHLGFEIHTEDSQYSNDWQGQIKEQLAVFADSVMGRCIQYTPASDALEVVRVIEACYQMREISLPSWEAKWLKIPA